MTSIGRAIGPERNLLSDVAGARPPAGPAVPGDRQRPARQDRAHQRRRRPARVCDPRRPRPLRGQRRGRGAGGPARGDLRRGVRGDPSRRRLPRALRPRLGPRPGADPVAAAHLRGAPPPAPREDPHPGRAGRRGRRRPRGAPRRAAHRLRRGGGQPVPRHGDRRGPRPVRHLPGVDPEKAVANLIKALGKGVLKVMSKMGISTIASYRGAQVFEAIGLSQPLVDQYFTGTTTRLGGIGLDVIAAEVAARHADAYPRERQPAGAPRLAVGGEYQWRREGEPHLFDPETVFRLQHSTRTRRYDIFKQYTTRVDEQSSRLMTLRGLFEFTPGDETGRPASRRRGRAGQRDRQAVQHRRDVLRLDLHGGARDARDRDEQHRRQVEHRRGRRGRGPAARPGAPLGDQAGRVGPVRRDQRVPDRRRRHPDQDGAGRQARRGRPAARPQGLPVDRPRPGTRRPASGSSRRRRTTTSTRSRTWRS